MNKKPPFKVENKPLHELLTISDANQEKAAGTLYPEKDPAEFQAAFDSHYQNCSHIAKNRTQLATQLAWRDSEIDQMKTELSALQAEIGALKAQVEVAAKAGAK